MNVAFICDNLTVIDDREFITPSQAFEILYSGDSIQVCDPPDYGAENPYDVHSMPWAIRLRDVVSDNTLKNLSSFSREQIQSEVLENLRGYELSL